MIFSTLETPVLLNRVVKSYETKAHNRSFAMQTLKTKWDKELEASVLPKQSVPKSSLDIRVWLVQ